ncbi:ATP-binding protein [Streptacidiphilus sp. P02-A3a]|uniref:ATP-binding protein n=1 Tax=Streptacidiphilus sp. P02-A3a TaxID=2704468 RepID=UPI0015F79D37|nr:ATP-binding protein [Streptacidiphilus sp. P02-A3a]QMU68735.1 ATP-binding protein [Streptacidiphilus sp. P02-A3a]
MFVLSEERAATGPGFFLASRSDGFTVHLVASELIGNAVRACGDFVPLVVDIGTCPDGVTVKVHDPDGDRLPCRPQTALDDGQAESGRGLELVDLLTAGLLVTRTPVGKQLSCRVDFPFDRS